MGSPAPGSVFKDCSSLFTGHPVPFLLGDVASSRPVALLVVVSLAPATVVVVVVSSASSATSAIASAIVVVASATSASSSTVVLVASIVAIGVCCIGFPLCVVGLSPVPLGLGIPLIQSGGILRDFKEELFISHVSNHGSIDCSKSPGEHGILSLQSPEVGGHVLVFTESVLQLLNVILVIMGPLGNLLVVSDEVGNLGDKGSD